MLVGVGFGGCCSSKCCQRLNLVVYGVWLLTVIETICLFSLGQVSSAILGDIVAGRHDKLVLGFSIATVLAVLHTALLSWRLYLGEKVCVCVRVCVSAAVLYACWSRSLTRSHVSLT